MRLSLIVNILLVVAVATTVIGAGLFMNLLAVPGGATATATPPPNTGPLPTFTATPSPVTTETPSPQPTDRPSPGGTYFVQPGDNLTKIAVRYGISVADLIEANPQLVPPDYVIQIGDELTIPNPAAKCDGYEAYTVAPGDFLVAIGELFGVDWNNIADFNSLPWPGRDNVADIQPGDILCIPSEGWTPLPTEAAE